MHDCAVAHACMYGLRALRVLSEVTEVKTASNAVPEPQLPRLVVLPGPQPNDSVAKADIAPAHRQQGMSKAKASKRRYE